jgi:hypothetical protein
LKSFIDILVPGAYCSRSPIAIIAMQIATGSGGESPQRLASEPVL